MWLKRQCAVYNNVKRSGSRRKQNEPKVLLGESQRFQSKLNFTQGCTSTQHLTLICSEPRKTEHQHHHHHPAKSTLYALRVSCIGESHLSGNTHAKKKKKKRGPFLAPAKLRLQKQGKRVWGRDRGSVLSGWVI